MTQFYRNILLTGFIYNVVLMVVICIGKSLQDIAGMIGCGVFPDVVVSIGWYGFLWYARFCHGGHVISADYCAVGMKCDSARGY